jgi:hypothetical protein
VITQHVTAGGRIVELDTATDDGQVHVEITYQTITADSLGRVAEICTLIAVYLNGGMIKVPEVARRIYQDALIAEGHAIGLELP